MINQSDSEMDKMGRRSADFPSVDELRMKPEDIASMSAAKLNAMKTRAIADINARFGPYRAPTPVTIPKYKAIQEKTLELALLIHELCPESKEKATALTQLVGVKMLANAAVAIYSPQSEDCDAKATARNPSDSECATTRLD